VKRLTALFFAGLTICSFAARAAETQTVREVFVCSYVNGAGMTELLAARDALIELNTQLGLEDQLAFVWTPYKANVDFDLLWFANHENLNAFGKVADAYNSAEGTAALEAAFDDVVDCYSALYFQEQIYDGGELEITQPPILESFRCTFNAGKGLADLPDAIAYWKQTLDDLGTHKSYAAYMNTPFIANTPVDVGFFAVHPNVQAFAQTATAYQNSDGGAEADRRFDEIQNCETSLWNGQRVIPPME
jgi:hypothetical protein